MHCGALSECTCVTPACFRPLVILLGNDRFFETKSIFLVRPFVCPINTHTRLDSRIFELFHVRVVYLIFWLLGFVW